MPGVYDLLPSRKYVDELGLGYWVLDFKHLNYNETQDALKNVSEVIPPFLTTDDPEPRTVLSKMLLDKSEMFHAEYDSWSIPDSIKAYIIAGYGQPTLSNLWEYASQYDPFYSLEGDGTVPLDSAIAMRVDQTYYANLEEIGEKHSTMLNAGKIQDLILSLLNSNENVNIQYITTERPVLKSIPSDVNGDGVVDIFDLSLVAKALGISGKGFPADVNDDGVVSILDLVTVAAHFGERLTPAAPVASPVPSNLSAEVIEKWLAEARAADDGSELFRRGIAVLESLINAIVPGKTALFPNYPNPFNPETWIPYQLSEASDVTMTIYDMGGRVVKRLDFGYQPAGIYRERARAAYWDGRNKVGELVASGVYFVELRTKKFRQTQRIVMLK